MYSRVILIALASVVIIIALLPYLAYRLSNSNTALKVRDWLSAYSGLIAVFIAIVASFPVFGQLEEMRVASSSATIQLIAGAQQALDSERGRVQELQSIAMRSIFSIAHPPTDLTHSLVEWNIKLENLIDEFKHKQDTPPHITEARVVVIESAQKFANALPDLERQNESSESLVTLSRAAHELITACRQYVDASHLYIEALHKSVSAQEKKYFDYFLNEPQL